MIASPSSLGGCNRTSPVRDPPQIANISAMTLWGGEGGRMQYWLCLLLLLVENWADSQGGGWTKAGSTDRHVVPLLDHRVSTGCPQIRVASECLEAWDAFIRNYFCTLSECFPFLWNNIETIPHIFFSFICTAGEKRGIHCSLHDRISPSTSLWKGTNNCSNPFKVSRLSR